jgi:hypothetical protein
MVHIFGTSLKGIKDSSVMEGYDLCMKTPPPHPPPQKKKKHIERKRISKTRDSSYNFSGILTTLPTSEKVITRLSTTTSSRRCKIDSSIIFFKQVTYL